jgi:hypothetical protein
VARDMDWDEALADLVAARVDDPEMVTPDGVDPEMWEEAGRLALVAGALRHSAQAASEWKDDPTPALEDDPVAAALGLLPDRHFALDQKALVRARKAAGMTVSDLASALSGRGWQVRTADVFRWESRPVDDVAPALIAAMAAVLRTTSDQLSTDRSTGVSSPFDAATRTARFAALVSRFARLQDMSEGMAASALRSRALATVHRGGEPDLERWLDSLEHFVAALEGRDER